MNTINLHNISLTAKEKEFRLCLLLTRIETLIAYSKEGFNEKDFREELRSIDFEFKKVNYYDTEIYIGDNLEVVDNMLFVVDNKINEAIELYEKLF